MGKLILNGRDYSGLINANGVFIDTDVVVKATTTVDNTIETYTPTQDCAIVANLWTSGANEGSSLAINGVKVITAFSSSGITGLFDSVFVKSGQVITIESSGESEYTVYGIQAGSNVGTNVVANPTGAATANLEKIQIDNTIYAV